MTLRQITIPTRLSTSDPLARHTRSQLLESITKFSNGLPPLRTDTELFSGSWFEWQLRQSLEDWQARNFECVYGCESPQPLWIRACLALGNLRLMQYEWLNGDEV